MGKRNLALTCLVIFLTTVAIMQHPAPIVAQGGPLYGGTLRIAYFGDPISMNGILKFWGTTAYPIANILDKLVSYGDHYQFVGDLAKSWTVSTDSKSITFNLRNDVWWSDGVKFTSADVKWHYQMLLNSTSVVRPLLNSLVSIVTPDDNTVTFTFKDAGNLYTLLLPFGLHSTGADQRILPKHTFRWGTSFNFTNNPVNTGVGMPVTGPYMVQQYSSGQSITLVRNPLYGVKSFTDHHPAYLDKLIYVFITTSTAAEAALESGQVDLVHEGTQGTGVDVRDVGRLRKAPGITVDSIPFFGSYRLTFNFGNQSVAKYPWVKNQLVREAFSHAIDRDSIIRDILSNTTVPSYGPIASFIKDWYNPSITKYTYDPAKAEALLDQAGLKKDSTGMRLHIPIIMYASMTFFSDALKSMLLKVGIDANLIPIDNNTFFSKYETGPGGLGEYPIGLQTFQTGPFPYIIKPWTYGPSSSPNGQNCGFYNDTTVNQLEASASTTNDLTKVKEYYDQVQGIISIQEPYVFLWEGWKISAYNSNYQGIIKSMTPSQGWYGSGFVEAWWTKGSPTLGVTTTSATQPTTTSGTDMMSAAAVVVIILILSSIWIYKRSKKNKSA